MNAVTPDTVEGLLAELDALCIQLHADGDRLCFRPHEAVTADLAARLKTHKAKLLVEVAKRARWTDGWPSNWRACPLSDARRADGMDSPRTSGLA